jgi:hypothetical protein
MAVGVRIRAALDQTTCTNQLATNLVRTIPHQLERGGRVRVSGADHDEFMARNSYDGGNDNRTRCNNSAY